MPTLSSLVVQRHVATMREVEEAIARQVLHGGDLLTNLLDMAPEREARLAEVLAESLELPVGPVGRLPPPEAEALDAMTPELALRHAIFPLAVEGQALLCATSEPLSHEAVAELGAAIGRALRFVAAPFLRVREGVAAHYGVPLERRLVKIVAKLDGLRAPAGTSTRPPPVRRRADPSVRIEVVGGPDPEPASFPSVELGPASRGWPEDLPSPSALVREPLDARDVPHGVRELPSYRPPPDLPMERSSTPPTTPGELVRWLRQVADAERRARARPPRRRGPLPIAEAEELVDAASTADGVLDALFAFASQYFEYSALFGVRGDLAEGHDAWGPGTPRDAIVGIGVPLDLPSCLARARERRAPLLERIPEEGLDRELLADLGRLRPGVARGAALVLPVLVRGRTVALLVGDDGAADVDLAALGPVIALAHRAGSALERVALARKRGVSSDAPRARVSSMPASPRRPSVDRDKAAAALVGAAFALDAPSAAPAADAEPAPGTVRSSQASGLEADVPSLPPPPASSPPGPPTDPYLGPPLDQLDEPPYPRAHLDDRREPGTLAPPRSDARAGAPSSHPPPRGRSDPPGHQGEPAPSLRRGGRPDLGVLLARASRGGSDGAVARAVLLSEAQGGLAALMAHFPGPLTVDRSRARSGIGPASRCGVLLSVLAELGWPALPFVTTRASSADVDQRFWATHLLAELPFVEAATAVVPRLFDDDLSVRRIARASATRLVALGLPDDPVTATLEDIAHDPQESRVRRALAAETLEAIRREVG